MMGQHGGNQDRLFYSFNLDSHVSPDHLLRGIDRFLDLSDLRRHLASFYSHTGRPSIDPELMVRMLLIGYCFGIRSERRLCEEVHLNLAYRWFCRLGLEDAVPDHSSFSKNRHGRFRDSDAFRQLFEGLSSAASPKAWWVAKASRSTRASSAPMRTAAAEPRPRRRSTGRRRNNELALYATTWRHSTRRSRSVRRRSTSR